MTAPVQDTIDVVPLSGTARHTVTVRLVAAVAIVITLVGCSDSALPSDGTDGTDDRAGAAVSVETVYDGLVGPTQLVVVDDDTFLVATINGAENDELGQVLRIDRRSGQATVLRDRLDKPTGIAVVGGELWVMERDRLSRGPLDPPGDGTDSDAVMVVADELPNNGRSEGTLTVTPEGVILFNTSGAKRGAVVTDGSGRLFTVDPAEVPGSPTELASGFKHAYAHVYDDDGTLWTTEMTDGSFDGEPGADELVAVVAGADHGWPRCVGDNRPVAEYGGDPRDVCPDAVIGCAVRSRRHADLGRRVTFCPGGPVGRAVERGRIVSIDVGDGTGGGAEIDPERGWRADAPAPVTEVLTGLDGPQHLVATDDAVYLTEFGTGRILRLATL